MLLSRSLSLALSPLSGPFLRPVFAAFSAPWRSAFCWARLRLRPAPPPRRGRRTGPLLLHDSFRQSVIFPLPVLGVPSATTAIHERCMASTTSTVHDILNHPMDSQIWRRLGNFAATSSRLLSILSSQAPLNISISLLYRGSSLCVFRGSRRFLRARAHQKQYHTN